MADRPEPIYGIGVCGGALGLELALEVAIPGYRTCAVLERETAVAGRMAQRIKEGSLPDLAWWDDVTTFDGASWRGIVSVLSAGFPCQPFSVAGKRKGKEDARWIWPDIKRIVKELGEELEIVLLENVPGLLLSTHSDFDRWDLEASTGDSIGGFGTVLSDLAELGFDAEWICIKASDVGAAHGRKRVFILAYRNGARLGRYARQHDGGSPLQTSRSGECGGFVEHSARFRTGESADQIHALATGREARPESSSGCGHVANSARSEFDGCEGETGRLGRRGVLETSEQLEDANSGRLSGSGVCEEQPRRTETECGSEELGNATRGRLGECGESPERVGLVNRAIEELGCFAYGPSDPRWEDVLVRYPWLRPSYSQAEAESDLRDVANGLEALVAFERTGALRALGNGVVPLQAAVAFTILLRRVLKNG